MLSTTTLQHLGLDALDVVNLRVGDTLQPTPGSIAEPFAVLAELQQQGLIRHHRISDVSSEQLTEAQSIAPVVCVQNFYKLAHRADDDLVNRCARERIAYTPFFPLGGFAPMQSGVLDRVATRLGASPLQLVLACCCGGSARFRIKGQLPVLTDRDNPARADQCARASGVQRPLRPA